MKIVFNLSKEERKRLVAAISELTGWASVYKGAPSFAFAVNNYIIERTGTIIYDERTSADEVRVLLTGLSERGFVFEGDIDEIAPAETAPGEISGTDTAGEMGACFTQSSENGRNEGVYQNGTPFENASTADVPDRLELELPLEGFTRTALDNLDKLVEGKAALIMKAIGSDALPIIRTVSTLQFPWFPFSASKDEIDAYSKFVCALCDLAKKQKRVTMKESKAESEGSEKYAFRCFLLRLGFIGEDYKTARNVLLSKLSGNGSFKTGDHKRVDAAEAATIADSGEENAEAITVHETEPGATIAATGGVDAVPLRCGDCLHHCYYSDGLMRKKSGDVVDTSNRTPGKYTHYCLGAPSGFRKLKHATDWSGSETAPKWCPLQSESNNSVTVREDENDTENAAASGTEPASYAYNPNLSDYDALMSRGGN